MAVRPIEFQGMIQNTQEVSQNRNTELQRPQIQQDQVANTIQQEVIQARIQVGESEQSKQNDFDSDQGGDGTGYEGNRGNRREKKKTTVKVSEGAVKKKSKDKNAYTPFDIKL